MLLPSHHQLKCTLLKRSDHQPQENTSFKLTGSGDTSCISRGFPEKQNWYILHTHIKQRRRGTERERETGIYKGWEIPRSAICMLETQESQWCKWKAWELKSQWCRLQSGWEDIRTKSTKGRKRLMCWVQQLGREGIQHSFALLFVLFRSSVGWTRPTTLGRTLCFSQLTNPDTNLFWEHPQRYTEKYSFTSYPGIKIFHRKF